MGQLSFGFLLKWVEECDCKICEKKATWIDCNSGYCDDCFPHYPEMRIDKRKFINKKKRSFEKEIRSRIRDK